jgi:hypothetical protein
LKEKNDKNQRVKALWKAGFEKKRNPRRVSFLLSLSYYAVNRKMENANEVAMKKLEIYNVNILPSSQHGKMLIELCKYA